MPLRDVQSGTSIILELPPHLLTPNRGGRGGGGGAGFKALSATHRNSWDPHFCFWAMCHPRLKKEKEKHAKLKEQKEQTAAKLKDTNAKLKATTTELKEKDKTLREKEKELKEVNRSPKPIPSPPLADRHKLLISSQRHCRTQGFPGDP